MFRDVKILIDVKENLSQEENHDVISDLPDEIILNDVIESLPDEITL